MKRKSRATKPARFSAHGIVIRLPKAQHDYIERAVQASEGLKSRADVIREIVRFYIIHHPQSDALPMQ
jgi:metal-responsive CopG/Arc/MetJ family transcriptional regulator